MVDWAELNHDLLVLVAKRIKKPVDFVSFGSVCSTWRAAASKKNFKGLRLRQNIPCLMLPRGDMEDEDHGDRQFYSLLDDEIVAKVNLPNFKGKRCIESLGWFLCSTRAGDMSLLHPFTGQEIQLPHQSTFPILQDEGEVMDPYIFMHKMVLSASPIEASNYTIMVICSGRGVLAFWRPGTVAGIVLKLGDQLMQMSPSVMVNFMLLIIRDLWWFSTPQDQIQLRVILLLKCIIYAYQNLTLVTIYTWLNHQVCCSFSYVLEVDLGKIILEQQ